MKGSSCLGIRVSSPWNSTYALSCSHIFWINIFYPENSECQFFLKITLSSISKRRMWSLWHVWKINAQGGKQKKNLHIIQLASSSLLPVPTVQGKAMAERTLAGSGACSWSLCGHQSLATAFSPPPHGWAGGDVECQFKEKDRNPFKDGHWSCFADANASLLFKHLCCLRLWGDSRGPRIWAATIPWLFSYISKTSAIKWFGNFCNVWFNLFSSLCGQAFLRTV